MYFFVLLTFPFFAFVNGYEENGKYIDLMPDADKQVFLNQVAKRIIEDVTHKNIQPNGSREISNSELDQQADYVKKVLEEESNNLRRQKHEKSHDKSDHDKVERAGNDNHDMSYLDLTLRNVDMLQKTNNNAEHEMIIPVKTVYDTGSSNNNVNYIYPKATTLKYISEISDYNDIQARGLKRNHKKASDTQFNILKPGSKDTTTRDIMANHDNEISTVKAALKVNKVNSQVKDNSSSEEINKEADTTFSDIITDKIMTVTSEATLNNSRVTRNTGDRIINKRRQIQTIKREKQSLRTNFNETIESSEESGKYNKISKPSNDTASNVTESAILQHMKTTSQKTSIVPITTTTSKSIAEVNFEITTDQTKLMQSANETINSAIIDNKTLSNVFTSSENISTKNTTPLKEKVELFNVLTTTKVITKLKNTTDVNNNLNYVSSLTKLTTTKISPNLRSFMSSSELHVSNSSEVINNNQRSVVKEDAILNKLANLVRQSLNLESDNENSHVGKDYRHDKLPSSYKEYEVFEISGRSAFQFQNDETVTTPLQEQPYYAPIYNYKPENAYFNTFNRLGPNDVNNENTLKPNKYDSGEDRGETSGETKREISEELYHRKFKLNKNLFYNHPKRPQNKYYATKLLVAKSPTLSDVNLNPNDYVDYYIGRNGIDRNTQNDIMRKKKEIHIQYPFDTIKNMKAKSFLSDVRKLLYKHKTNGKIQRKPNREIKKSKVNERITTLNNELRKIPMLSEISMDYYYSPNDDMAGRLLKSTETEDPNIKKSQTPTKYATRITYGTENDKIKKNTATLMELLKVGDPSKFLKNLDTMLSLKIPYGRNRRNGKVLDIFLNVLNDMIQIDDEALVQFDWLGTASDIHAAVEKLSSVIETVRNKSMVHNADLQLLKYVLYLYFTSKHAYELKELKKEKKSYDDLAMENILKNGNLLKTEDLLDRVWLHLRGGRDTDSDDEAEMVEKLDELNTFFQDLLLHLFNFHSALKDASANSYRDSTWYANLKNCYLKNAPKAHRLEILLHLGSTRLFDLIEDRARTGLGGDLTDDQDVKETLDVFMLIMKVLNEMHGNK
ncbi:hypothetical protein ACJJTC_017411 [Scirpophaga incertulas]